MGEDKYENFNRKVFAFNLKLNKYAIRPVHTIWASVMPKYGMDRIQSAYTNIEYPKRLASCLIQKDFKASGRETLSFLANTTLGLGGLYKPAQSVFKIEPAQENMTQALSKVNVKSGAYLVMPVISSTNVRDLAGRLLECPLDPALYLASPLTAMVKSGLVVNKTAYMQPMSKMLESTYADPYDIAKKLYGIENYIKNANLDRKDVLEAASKSLKGEILDINTAVSMADPVLNGETTLVYPKSEADLQADIVLTDYKPQSPLIDAMRTALFDLPEINNSVWSEMSVWNRSFGKQFKTASVQIVPEREPYKYRYILQKDRSAPAAIIYPSVGEGINSHHSVVLAKLFYDEGYSVIIQGSHFNWEFVKSMPDDYRPGIPSEDTDYLKIVTMKIFNSLQEKYGYRPAGKVVIGTSFGAVETLFLADKEAKNNTLNITKYISICPPVELIFALRAADRISVTPNSEDLKQKTAISAAKIIQISQLKQANPDFKPEQLPFNEEEARLITGFIMRQKLSDLIFTLENSPKSEKSDVYQSINNMNYRDYVEKYILSQGQVIEDVGYETSLHSIADFLRNNNNYKIYHALDDYFVNREQLKQLKDYSGDNIVFLNNGSHLGFLYRQEFIDELRKDISLRPAKQLKKI